MKLKTNLLGIYLKLTNENYSQWKQKKNKIMKKIIIISGASNQFIKKKIAKKFKKKIKF